MLRFSRISRPLLAFLILGIMITGGIIAKKKFWDPPRYPYVYENSIANDALCERCELKIPKVIHRIWTQWGPVKKDLPPLYKEYDNVLKKLHPDWTIVEWDDEKIEAFIKEHHPEFWETYISYDRPVKKHDAIRYYIVDHFGGVFVQHSLRLMKNIEPLLRGHSAVFFEQSTKDHVIQNGFFAATAHHPIFTHLKKGLKNRTKMETLQATGPNFVTGLVRQILKKSSDFPIKIYPSKYMYPFLWDQKSEEPVYSHCIKNAERCHLLFPDAYGFSIWRTEWIELEKAMEEAED